MIPTNSIDIWTIPLDSTIHSFEESRALLSATERLQADRFKFPELKRRYTMAHAGLRRILALYISDKPKAITYEINAFGKPALAADTKPATIQFNLSHSGELALVAVAQGRPVGVDVEWIKPLTDHMKIAEHHFSPDEMAVLKAMDSSKSHEGFIQLWAGKEALLKARGKGLNLPLNQFSLAELIEHPGKTGSKVLVPGETASWFVYKLILMPGYRGAVAIEGGIQDIQYRVE